jgi:hypothetical protein
VDHTTGHALQAIHQRRNGHLRRVVHQQVDVIILTVEFHQFSVKVGADAYENAL